MAEWENWSGSVRCTPRRIETPASEADIVAAVRRAAAAGLRVRVAGAGHSFTPLVATDGVLLALDGWKGVEAHDRATHTATIRAGATLHDVGEELFARGLGMANLGDVDVQSVAGAIATGTHGTGPTLGNIATQIAAMRLVTAMGEVVTMTEAHDPDRLRAARVSLGLLGVTSTVTLRLLPAYRLHERVWREPVDGCLDRLAGHIAGNVRFEFFWFPETDEAECKTLNPTDRPPDAEGDAVVMGTPAGADAAGAPRRPAERERVGWSHRIIPSIRTRRFNEMEYALPAAAGPACFRAVRARMRDRHREVLWPVEYRTLAADDAWLSPAYGRETVTISIHQDARLPFRDFFADIEPIFRAHAGRPHWGKIHHASTADLAAAYPKWADFGALRARMDPDGRFLNDELRRLFA